MYMYLFELLSVSRRAIKSLSEISVNFRLDREGVWRCEINEVKREKPQKVKIRFFTDFTLLSSLSDAWLDKF